MKKENKELNETTVKCRFFAQYWGQNLLGSNHFLNTKAVMFNYDLFGSLKSANNEILSAIDAFKTYFLWLKPLSDITDEDAIECAKMFNWLQISETPQLWNHPSTKEKVVKMNDNWKYGICILSIEKLNLQQIDYLRSKGYALPFMEYSVEDLVSLGWVRLI